MDTMTSPSSTPPRHDLSRWQHPHHFATGAEARAERRTRWVVALTLVTMVAEIIAGWLTGSMALLADGWHMGSHVAALGLTAFAYRYARRRADDARFTFGTGKVSTLAGYTSALLLGVVALWMLVESTSRLAAPVVIRYTDAMIVAGLGLAVNLLSAWLLGDDHHHHDHNHHHHHDDGHDHEGHDHEGDHHDAAGHVDHNLRSAYLHVLADALTSVLALVALGAGSVYGWSFLDPLMGIVGAVVVGRWAWGLARESAQVLLDAEEHGDLAARIRAAIEADPDQQVADLHLWRIGPASRACILSIVSHQPLALEHYRERLALLIASDGLDHLTIELHQCRDEACVSSSAPPK
jgi:cation diffusion facilitator family transporter